MFLEKYLGTYLRLYYVDDLDKVYAVELLKKLLDKNRIEYTEIALEYAVECLGGNPSNIIEFVNMIRNKKVEEISIKDIEQIINELTHDIESRIELLIHDLGCTKLQQFSNIEYSWIDYGDLRKKIEKEVIDRLIRENVLVWRNGTVRFQNKLIMYAFKKIFHKHCE